MTKSSRLTPNQFGQGLTLDATRLEHDLVALANRYNAPLPCDIARRWVENHMVTGFIPNTFPVDPYVSTPLFEEQVVQALPWMGAYNPPPVGTASPGTAADAIAPGVPAASITNEYRAKGTKQVGITPSDGLSNTLSFETSWTQVGPSLLDRVTLVLATDAFYSADFLWGADGSFGGGTPGDPVNNIVVQVLVDSALASELRAGATMPFEIRSFRADAYYLTQPGYGTVADGMEPPTWDGGGGSFVPGGLCIQAFPRQPLPEGARVRVIVSLPLYESTLQVIPLDVSSFGQHPWQGFVTSGHVTLLQPVGVM